MLCVSLKVNSLKDLYLLLEEESLAAHPQQGDNKMTSAEEQHLCPTISKELCVLEKSYTQVQEQVTPGSNSLVHTVTKMFCYRKQKEAFVIGQVQVVPLGFSRFFLFSVY